MINRMILQGRLVRDPELKYTTSNVAYTEVTIAWSEKYKEAETKCFLRCKAWRSTAEFLGKWFRKGQEIVIEGRMVTEEWEKDGKKDSRAICLLDRISFCGSKSDNAGGGAYNSPASVPDTTGFMAIPDNVDDEGLPFN